jgi:hypothetical protein
LYDDAASRKSDNTDARGRCDRFTSPHKVWGKNEAVHTAGKSESPSYIDDNNGEVDDDNDGNEEYSTMSLNLTHTY